MDYIHDRISYSEMTLLGNLSSFFLFWNNSASSQKKKSLTLHVINLLILTKLSEELVESEDFGWLQEEQTEKSNKEKDVYFSERTTKLFTEQQTFLKRIILKFASLGFPFRV